MHDRCASQFHIVLCRCTVERCVRCYAELSLSLSLSLVETEGARARSGRSQSTVFIELSGLSPTRALECVSGREKSVSFVNACFFRPVCILLLANAQTCVHFLGEKA